jgi:hypothetical protein
MPRSHPHPERKAPPPRSQRVCPLLQSRTTTSRHWPAATGGGTGSFRRQARGSHGLSGVRWPAPRLSTRCPTQVGVLKYRRMQLVATTTPSCPPDLSPLNEHRDDHVDELRSVHLRLIVLCRTGRIDPWVSCRNLATIIKRTERKQAIRETPEKAGETPGQRRIRDSTSGARCCLVADPKVIISNRLGHAQTGRLVSSQKAGGRGERR